VFEKLFIALFNCEFNCLRYVPSNRRKAVNTACWSGWPYF